MSWTGWNFGNKGDKGSASIEDMYVITDIMVLGETSMEGRYEGRIVSVDKSTGKVVRSKHLDATTLDMLRADAQNMHDNASSHARARESHVGYSDPPGADWSMGGE